MQRENVAVRVLELRGSAPGGFRDGRHDSTPASAERGDDRVDSTLGQAEDDLGSRATRRLAGQERWCLSNHYVRNVLEEGSPLLP